MGQMLYVSLPGGMRERGIRLNEEGERVYVGETESLKEEQACVCGIDRKIEEETGRQTHADIISRRRPKTGRRSAQGGTMNPGREARAASLGPWEPRAEAPATLEAGFLG